MAVENCNEITVRVKGDLKEFYKNIEKKGFKVTDRFKMDDTFFIPQNLEIEKLSARDILKKAIIIRVVERSNGKLVKNITFKRKEFDDLGNIVFQSKVDCGVLDVEDAKKLLNAIGYMEVMRIKESDIVFEKDGFSFAVKDIENGDKLIESEPEPDDETMNDLEKLKDMFDKYEIPIYKDNYFVKKAEIELDKVLKRD